MAPAHAARGLPVVELSLDQALQQEQQLPQQQEAPLPSCISAPAQGASHNGVALPNLHVEAELRWAMRPFTASLHCRATRLWQRLTSN